jgi:hypothetical protein
MPSSSDETRRSTLATLSEIVDGENALKRAGIDVSDPDEWQQLGDIVARIERRLRAKEPVT